MSTYAEGLAGVLKTQGSVSTVAVALAVPMDTDVTQRIQLQCDYPVFITEVLVKLSFDTETLDTVALLWAEGVGGITVNFNNGGAYTLTSILSGDVGNVQGNNPLCAGPLDLTIGTAGEEGLTADIYVLGIAVPEAM